MEQLNLAPCGRDYSS